MAQLPPKVPSMTQNWYPSFPFQMMPLPPPPTTAQQNSWVDEFLDFSSARRSSHRRSVSDSVAFVEAPFVEECRNADNPTNISVTCNGHNFDGLDDEQLRNMFSDDIATKELPPLSSSDPASTNPSTPSDQNSENDEKNAAAQENQNLQPKNEPGEVDISTKRETETQTESPANPSADAIVDPKRIKRILANRQSAQRSRVRKLQYISELERSVTTLQTEVSALSPRVAFLDHQRLILNVDNSALKQRIAALAQDKIFKDAHQEALRKEIERLRHIYHEQNMQMMSKKAADEASPLPLPQPNLNRSGGTDQE
ncbi:basic leucine zipper 61-like [Coffea eugenioides]|uniref:Basic leucine zipper 34-like n=1 Tax=Coffea arabica TaxID=13443 RepID=A0A6P6S7B2_COFAR|nr:basic leucine zipper 61-like [Coffea arabica]XP_027171406.1 basic leucine zipper 61-like [Coffea eugenioides]